MSAAAKSTSTDVLARLVRATRHLVACDARQTGACAFYTTDDHYRTLVRALEEAERHLAELQRRPS
jgi:RecJ-like exonuclease